MSKIVLDEVTNSNNISKINENFAKLESALNDKVLYRDNPVGEVNSLVSDVDVNGVKLYNLPTPTLASQAARLQDVQQAALGAYGFVTLSQDAVPQTIPNISLGKAVSSTATLGSSGALPAQVSGYLSFYIGGVLKKLPYYNA
jgi:hypothetical protein